MMPEYWKMGARIDEKWMGEEGWPWWRHKTNKNLYNYLDITDIGNNKPQI